MERLVDVRPLTDELRRFAAERGWERFHAPRNLALALAGEVGELCAELQWLTDDETTPGAMSPEKQRAVADELADVAIYLVRLSDRLGIDLADAIAHKLAENRQRFPPTGDPADTPLRAPGPTEGRAVGHAGAMTDPLAWTRLDHRYGDGLMLFETRYDRYRHPANGKEFDRIVLESVDWVNCVAIDADGRHVMVRQFRFGTATTTLETPGGMVDEGEDSLTAIRRELLEETGYGGGDWRYLGSVQPNPAFHDHLCHHWLATGVERVAAPDPGEGEHIHVELLTDDEIVAASRTGEIRHALALSVLARVLDLWAPLRDRPSLSADDPTWGRD